MLAVGYHSYREVITKALHAPGTGYYSSHIRGVGRSGDFSTSATLGTSLAAAIARWAVEMSSERDVRTLIEVGAGDGSLAANILSHLPWYHPLRRGYHIVDSSEPLVELQKKKLGKKVRWFPNLETALEQCGGRALIVANELIDAFPPDVLEFRNGTWMEMGLQIEEGGNVREASRPWMSQSASALDPQHWPGEIIPEGQRIEALGSWHEWMQTWLPHWRSGACLWIDYGDTMPNLYYRRPYGTLRAYYRHERITGLDVFRRLGKQDITCDVNFTDIQNWGEALGLETRSLESQGSFIECFRKSMKTESNENDALGEAFKVLCQVKC